MHAIFAGNLWGQGWGHVYRLIIPYENATDYNVDLRMKEKVNYINIYIYIYIYPIDTNIIYYFM